MAFPMVGQHDAAKVRMVIDVDAEQIEDFALIPVGGAPYGGDGIDRRSGTADPNFQAHAVVAGKGVQVIDDFEARLNGIAVNGGDGAKADEIQLMFQLAAYFDDPRRFDFQSQLATIVLAPEDGLGNQ